MQARSIASRFSPLPNWIERVTLYEKTRPSHYDIGHRPTEYAKQLENERSFLKLPTVVESPKIKHFNNVLSYKKINSPKVPIHFLENRIKFLVGKEALKQQQNYPLCEGQKPSFVEKSIWQQQLIELQHCYYASTFQKLSDIVNSWNKQELQQRMLKIQKNEELKEIQTSLRKIQLKHHALMLDRERLQQKLNSISQIEFETKKRLAVTNQLQNLNKLILSKSKEMQNGIRLIESMTKTQDEFNTTLNNTEIENNTSISNNILNISNFDEKSKIKDTPIAHYNINLKDTQPSNKQNKNSNLKGSDITDSVHAGTNNHIIDIKNSYSNNNLNTTSKNIELSVRSNNNIFFSEHNIKSKLETSPHLTGVLNRDINVLALTQDIGILNKSIETSKHNFFDLYETIKEVSIFLNDTSSIDNVKRNKDDELQSINNLSVEEKKKLLESYIKQLELLESSPKVEKLRSLLYKASQQHSIGELEIIKTSSHEIYLFYINTKLSSMHQIACMAPLCKNSGGHADNSCPNCGTNHIVRDYSQGDVVCVRCGYVLEGSCLDDGAEWRMNSAEGAASSADASGDRVGHTSNPYLEDMSSGTSMLGTDRRMARWQHSLLSVGNSQDVVLKRAFALLSRIGVNLGFAKDGADVDEFYAIVYTLARAGLLKNQVTFLNMCAIAYIGCRRMNVSRSFGEISEANRRDQPSLTGRDIAKAYTKLRKMFAKARLTSASAEAERASLGVSPPVDLPSSADVEEAEDLLLHGPTTWHDFMPRFCSKLQLEPRIEKHAARLANVTKTYGLSSGKTPQCVAGVALYIYAALLSERSNLTFNDVAIVTQVRENILRSCYASILPHLPKLLPKNIVEEKEKQVKLLMLANVPRKKQNRYQLSSARLV